MFLSRGLEGPSSQSALTGSVTQVSSAGQSPRAPRAPAPGTAHRRVKLPGLRSPQGVQLLGLSLHPRSRGPSRLLIPNPRRTHAQQGPQTPRGLLGPGSTPPRSVTRIQRPWGAGSSPRQGHLRGQSRACGREAFSSSVSTGRGLRDTEFWARRPGDQLRSRCPCLLSRAARGETLVGHQGRIDARSSRKGAAALRASCSRPQNEAVTH